MTALEAFMLIKLFGRLDCAYVLCARLRAYAKGRVFFADATTGRAAGYRPCGWCIRAQ
ncbi:MAG: hypothetical protein ABIU76_17350 [Gemmatimonadaceae bacterium]